MQINVTYDSSVNAAPIGFTAVVADVVQFYDSQFADPITINIHVGWGEVNGQTLDANALGESISNYTATSYDYAQIKTTLDAAAVTSDAMNAVATLPSADPTGGGLFSMTTAEAKALGLIGANGAVDGWVGFSNTPSTFDFSVTTNGGSGQQVNGFDFFSVVAHEFSEIMGRQMNFGAASSGGGYYPLDLFDYSAAGARSFDASAATRYFSIDGGVVDLFDFNTGPKGDLFDWSAGDGVLDAFNAFARGGWANPVGGVDLTLMDVLGYIPTPVFAAAIQAAPQSFNGETLSFQIYDQSQGPAPASTAGIYVTPNLGVAPTTADTLLASYSTPAIAAFGTVNGTLALPLSTLAPGAYSLDVIADANGAVVQSRSALDASGSTEIGILSDANLASVLGDNLGANFDLGGLNLTGATSFGNLYVGAAVNGAGTMELGPSAVFGPGASLGVAQVQVGVNTYAEIETYLGYAGFWNQTAGGVKVDAGATLDLSGSGNVIESIIQGPGKLALSGGSTTFGPPAVFGIYLTVPTVAVSGATTHVNLATNLPYAGRWTQSAGTLSVAAGDTLSFTGAGDTFSGTLAGAGTVAFAAGTDTLSGLTSDVGRLSVTAGEVLVASGGATLAGAGEVTLDGATSLIEGATSAATLTNAGRIWGAGRLGGGQMTLVNQAGAYIESSGAGLLTIDTGSATVTNAGVIESAGPVGGVTIASALTGGGRLIAYSSTLTVMGAVSGAQTGVVAGGGVLDFASAFNGNVAFAAGSTGTLELGQSKTDVSGAVTGLSAIGANALDFGDIAFVAGVTKATFSGSTTSGVLTVKQGSNSAAIRLIGNYLGSTFTASADGHGGTRIIDTRPAHWASDVSGAFATAAHWIDGAVPSATNDAVLDAPGSAAYTVTASTSQSVNAIQTAATATLAITGGTFTAASGTGVGANGGAISVAGGATLMLGGVFADSGAVNLQGGALIVAGAGLTLTGGGELALYGAGDVIEGASPTATLVNAGQIWGAGQVGAGQMTLLNQVGATIESSGAGLMTLDTGARTIVNAGVIESNGPVGGVTIASAVANTGDLIAFSSTLTVSGAVTGNGIGVVAGGGTLAFASAFNENVTFAAGATGTLRLAQSQGYTAGAVTGLSTTGANALDLGDIAFTSGVTKATFAGSAASGVLTVTDGTHTARITVIGAYIGHAFTTSDDAHGGTRIVDPPPPASAPHAFIAAMASLGGNGGAILTQAESHRPAIASLANAHPWRP